MTKDSDYRKRLAIELGEKIRFWRLQRGFTQAELEKAAELPHNVIGGYENARRSPSAFSLYKIALVLRTHPGEFFPWDKQLR